MNLLAQLTAIQPQRTKSVVNEAPRIAINAKIVKAKQAYKKAFQNDTLTTPELADRLGYASSSSIAKTLLVMVERGWVEFVGKERRGGQYGKPANLWKWIGE